MTRYTRRDSAGPFLLFDEFIAGKTARTVTFTRTERCIYALIDEIGVSASRFQVESKARTDTGRDA